MVSILAAGAPRFLLDLRASLFWVPEGDDHVAIAAGTLDQPTGLRTVAHIFVADAGDYYTIADGLKTYPGTQSPASADK
jgi:hypothetical protein